VVERSETPLRAGSARPPWLGIPKKVGATLLAIVGCGKDDRKGNPEGTPTEEILVTKRAWLRSLFARTPRRAPEGSREAPAVTPRVRRATLYVEELEGRCVPAIWLVNAAATEVTPLTVARQISTVEEAAGALGISATMASRSWASTRAWLHQEISGGAAAAPGPPREEKKSRIGGRIRPGISH
jgi:hypothetical protein